MVAEGARRGPDARLRADHRASWRRLTAEYTAYGMGNTYPVDLAVDTNMIHRFAALPTLAPRASTVMHAVGTANSPPSHRRQVPTVRGRHHVSVTNGIHAGTAAR